MVIINFVSSGAAWPITLGLGVGLGAGYSNCRHQFLWHGPHGPPFHFGRPPWAGGGRPYWGRPSKDGEKHPPCHEEQKVLYKSWSVDSLFKIIIYNNDLRIFFLLAVIVQICWIPSVHLSMYTWGKKCSNWMQTWYVSPPNVRLSLK